jgi:phenylalanyl-tRNA synthetase beta subunit
VCESGNLLNMNYFFCFVTDAQYLDGRGAAIMWKDRNGKTIQLGTVGILHPDVVTGYDLHLPVSVLNLNIQHFV